MTPTKKLGEILVECGVVTPEKVTDALTMQEERGGLIGEHLISMRQIDERELLGALSMQLNLPMMEKIDMDQVEESLTDDLNINWVKSNAVLPLAKSNGHIQLAVADPLNTAPIDDLQTLFGCPMRPVIVPTEAVINAINQIYDKRSGAEEALDQLEVDESSLENIANELEEPKDIIDETDEAPIIRLVNSVLFQAVKEKASDIHVEPFERHISVRFRRDGVLSEVIKPPKRFQQSIAARLKIMAGMNIAERRLPQDGRIRIKIAGQDIDIRVSSLPTAHGERIVLRLLDSSAVVLDINTIGFSQPDLATMHQLITKAHGILLVTGPTGSGKTTTLYSCLSEINRPDLNILTVEDPVEFQLHGIGQMQVNSKINLTFASGLRTILRQDPDVIMIGEIRDLETAEIAIQSSLTGHLVLSTLHTNDAASAFTRLNDMGIEPFLIASSLVGVLAQRLVRRLCPTCREAYQPTAPELEQVGLNAQQGMNSTVYRPKEFGCEECAHSGYKGRMGIYELLPVRDELRDLVMKNANSQAIKKIATKMGMNTLREDGALKVLSGHTSIEEVLRVTQVDSG